MVSSPPDAIGNRLRANPASADDAVRLAREIWGLDVVARRLSGEKDVNFRLTDAAGHRSLIKIYSADTEPGVVAMQTAALRHVAVRDPDLPIQRVIPAANGEDCSVVRLADGERRTLRMVSFLEGIALDTSVNSTAQRRAVGRMSARLQNALVDFGHPNDDHPLVWDMKTAAALRPHLAFFEGAERRLLERVLDLFETRIAPVIPRLPTQVVHNDFNGDNLLVAADDHDRICGVIDFDDMVRAPRLFDLAVTCSYQMREEADPVAAVRDCLDGYLETGTLEPEERALLPVAILTRMAMRIIVPEWRAHQLPDNRAYVTRNCDLVRRQFARLDGLSVEAFAERLAALRFA